MKRILSTVLVVILLLGLGALAVLARGGDALVPVRTASVAAAPVTQGEGANSEVPVIEPAVLAPEAPMITERWNNIAMPLVMSGISSADAVANYINSNTIPPDAANSVTKVGYWDAPSQALVIRNVGSRFGTPDFPVQVGDWLFVSVNNTYEGTSTFAWVGGVPESSRSYELVANAWSAIMMPLASSVATADDLAASIGDVSMVAKWDADSQGMIIRNVGSRFGVQNYPVSIGYPYFVWSTVSKTWP